MSLRTVVFLCFITTIFGHGDINHDDSELNELTGRYALLLHWKNTESESLNSKLKLCLKRGYP